MTALAQTQALIAQHDLQFANVTAARAVVASTAASLEQNGRDVARQRRLLATGSSSIETREKLDTDRVRVVAQLAQNRAQTLCRRAPASAVLEAQIAQSEAAVAAQRARHSMPAEDQSRLHHHQGDPRRCDRTTSGQARTVGGSGQSDHDPRPAAQRLGDCEL